MLILGIESTCDETGIALVENGRTILKNEMSSSVLLHQKYGGVIPEIAAREQLKIVIPLLSQIVSRKIVSKIDAIAVSFGPGLIGSLLVGVETAKALALAWDKKLIAVNHLVGHFYASWLSKGKPPSFPCIGLVVSGGHTDLLLFQNHKKYRHLGGTNDDAAGEAFDKIARFLDLGYPGGPEIEKLAEDFAKEMDNGGSIRFPRPVINSPDFNFSFSGLKTSVVNYVNNFDDKSSVNFSKIAFYFQEAIVDVLISKTLKAANKYGAKSIVVGGGVAANSILRSQLKIRCNELKIKSFFPEKAYSVDNGAMIASAAFFNQNSVDPLTLVADSGLYF
jgi:N6-L-threonylcarbamoyladenine synthase